MAIALTVTDLERRGRRSGHADGKGTLRATADAPVHALQASRAGQDSELPSWQRVAIPQGRDNALDGSTV